MTVSIPERYTESELKALWYYCRNQWNEIEIVADLACISESKARKLIQKWRESMGDKQETPTGHKRRHV